MVQHRHSDHPGMVQNLCMLVSGSMGLINKDRPLFEPFGGYLDLGEMLE
jgi:hypothetical protein